MKLYSYVLSVSDCSIVKETHEARECEKSYKINHAYFYILIKKRDIGVVNNTYAPRLWLVAENDALARELFAKWLIGEIKGMRENIRYQKERLTSCKKTMTALENGSIEMEVADE